MKKNIFHYNHYRQYLMDILGKPGTRSGLRQKLADAINVQASHVSQVLRGHTEFTPEQAERIAKFLELPKQEARYFLLLIHKDRAGTMDLRRFYDDEVRSLQEENLSLSKQVKQIAEIPDHIKSRYYSSWLFMATHFVVRIAKIKKPKEIAEYLGVETKEIERTLHFLLEWGLIEHDALGYRTSASNIFLSKDAPQISNHHMNWRARALESLAHASTDDIHYSSVATMSFEAAQKIKDRLIQMINENVEIIEKSEDQTLQVFTLDFFSLERRR